MTIPIEAGRCWKCGNMTYHGLAHHCPTTTGMLQQFWSAYAASCAASDGGNKT